MPKTIKKHVHSITIKCDEETKRKQLFLKSKGVNISHWFRELIAHTYKELKS